MFGLFKNDEEAEICKKIIRHADDAVVAIDEGHRIILFNEGAERIFGYRSEEILGEPLNTLIPTRFHMHHDLLVSEFAVGDTSIRHMAERTRQVYGLRKDGTEFLSSTTIMKVGSGRRKVFAAIVRDISENKKTEDELLRLAATDPLTGAFNRREFLALTERESLRSRRYHRPLSVLLMDIDNFKTVNDSYGHAAGDKALQKFTTVCCNALRNVDIFGRWGGEEFVVMLPETDIEGAAIIAERLRKMVSEIQVDSRGQKFNITVSIGVSQYRDDEVNIDGPLNRADAAVYDAKKAGRNRVAVYRND